MAKKEARRPDYVVLAKVKDEANARGVAIGAAWKIDGPFGKGIGIKLNPGTKIAWNDGLWLSLWPHQDKRGAGELEIGDGDPEPGEPPFG